MSNLDTFHSQQFSNEEKSSASNKTISTPISTGCFFNSAAISNKTPTPLAPSFAPKIGLSLSTSSLSLLLLLFAIYIICFYFYLNLGTEQTIMETLYTIFAINIKEKKLSTPIINV